MTEERICRECGSRIDVTQRVVERTGRFDVFCKNTEDHEGDSTIPMLPPHYLTEEEKQF